MSTAAAPAPPPSRRMTLLVFAVLLLFQIAFQATRGAWTSDLGGDPDEAAHAVTSLMLRDYLAGGWTQSPLAFAQNYYMAFPKVALGHYPPGYYVLAGAWLLPSPSITSLLLLQAVLAAVFGALMFRFAARGAPETAAWGAAVLATALPLTLKQAQFVMSDLLLASLCLLATAAWARYLESPGWRRALVFGMLAALAILTKGSAVALAMVPPVSTALARRWSLLKQPSWWLPALPVGVLAGPWMLYSSRITAEGMSRQPFGDYVRDTATFYATALPQVFGWLLLALMVLGLSSLLGSGCRHPGVSAVPSSALGLLAGVIVVSLLVPTGYSTRYLLPALPALLLAAVTAADSLYARLQRGRGLAFAVVIGGGLALTAPWPGKSVSGFSAAVSRAGLPPGGSQERHWLVASDPRGEGAIIAAAAFGCPQRAPSVLQVHRGSKDLASSDWLGRGYESAFADEAALLARLDKLAIERVFLDLSVPEHVKKPHEKMLARALAAAPERWSPDFEQEIIRGPGERGTMRVYKRL